MKNEKNKEEWGSDRRDRSSRSGQSGQSGQSGREKGNKGTGKQPLVSPVSFILIAVILSVLVFLSFIDPKGTVQVLKMAGGLFLRIIPVLLVVVIFMAAANLVPLSVLKKHLGSRSGTRGLMIAVFAGTLSHGPVHAWYPFLSDLREKGVSNGKIAAFLYARAVKIPLLAAMAFYFGISFTIIFSGLIILSSFFLGKLFESLG